MPLTDKEPTAASNAVRALWWLQAGDWERAHELVQEETADNNWVHAHLHRVEGDLANAGYWYRKAERPVCDGSLEDEFNGLVAALAG